MIISKVIVEDIYAEDLFKWFYEHVRLSGGDGAGAIVCGNYTNVAAWFAEWWRETVYPRWKERATPHLINQVNEKGFYLNKEMRDNCIIFRDGNENFIFANHLEGDMFRGEYVFIVKKDCKFGFDRKSGLKVIRGVS